MLNTKQSIQLSIVDTVLSVTLHFALQHDTRPPGGQTVAYTKPNKNIAGTLSVVAAASPQQAKDNRKQRVWHKHEPIPQALELKSWVMQNIHAHECQGARSMILEGPLQVTT